MQATKERYDAVIVDTAGRLQIDERMMGELKATQRAIKPSDTLLVVDAMTGQEAASLTKAFNEAAELTGDQRSLSLTDRKQQTEKKSLSLSTIITVAS